MLYAPKVAVMDATEPNTAGMDLLEAIELIERAEPDRLGLLAGDVARLVLDEADRQTNGGVDERSWAGVDAARAYASGEITLDDLKWIAQEAIEVAHESGERIVEPHVVAVAAMAAEVAGVLAEGGNQVDAAVL